MQLSKEAVLFVSSLERFQEFLRRHRPTGTGRLNFHPSAWSIFIYSSITWTYRRVCSLLVGDCGCVYMMPLIYRKSVSGKLQNEITRGSLPKSLSKHMKKNIQLENSKFKCAACMHLNEQQPSRQSLCHKSVVAVFDNKEVWWSMLVQRSKLDGDNDLFAISPAADLNIMPPKSFKIMWKTAYF